MLFASLAIDVEALRVPLREAAARRRSANRPSPLLGLYLTRTLPGRKRPRSASWLRRVFGL
jgi:hypothetical protein